MGSTSTPSKVLSKIATKRIQKELVEWQLNSPLGFKHKVTDNIHRWIIEVIGARGTIYANEAYQLHVDSTEHYTMESPQVNFLHPAPMHPHIYGNGHICLAQYRVLGNLCINIDRVHVDAPRRPDSIVSRFLLFRGYKSNATLHAHATSFGLARHYESQIHQHLCILNLKRFYATQVQQPLQRAKKALHLALVSPGIIFEPYSVPEPISFWSRWFTREGWKRTKQDCISELKTAFAIAKLRKLTKYSKKQFYEEAIEMYKKINSLLAEGDQTSLRHLVTENMYSTFKKELKQRRTAWHDVYWEMIEPAVRVRTLRARLMAVDKKNLDNAFVQITLEILTHQKFAAYDSHGNLKSGDTDKSILVKDVWVFERSLFHPDAKWRLCGRLSL